MSDESNAAEDYEQGETLQKEDGKVNDNVS